MIVWWKNCGRLVHSAFFAAFLSNTTKKNGDPPVARRRRRRCGTSGTTAGSAIANGDDEVGVGVTNKKHMLPRGGKGNLVVLFLSVVVLVAVGRASMMMVAVYLPSAGTGDEGRRRQRLFQRSANSAEISVTIPVYYANAVAAGKKNTVGTRTAAHSQTAPQQSQGTLLPRTANYGAIHYRPAGRPGVVSSVLVEDDAVSVLRRRAARPDDAEKYHDEKLQQLEQLEAIGEKYGREDRYQDRHDKYRYAHYDDIDYNDEDYEDGCFRPGAWSFRINPTCNLFHEDATLHRPPPVRDDLPSASSEGDPCGWNVTYLGHGS